MIFKNYLIEKETFNMDNQNFFINHKIVSCKIKESVDKLDLQDL